MLHKLALPRRASPITANRLIATIENSVNRDKHGNRHREGRRPVAIHYWIATPLSGLAKTDRAARALIKSAWRNVSCFRKRSIKSDFVIASAAKQSMTYAKSMACRSPRRYALRDDQRESPWDDRRESLWEDGLNQRFEQLLPPTNHPPPADFPDDNPRPVRVSKSALQSSSSVLHWWPSHHPRWQWSLPPTLWLQPSATHLLRARRFYGFWTM